MITRQTAINIARNGNDEHRKQLLLNHPEHMQDHEVQAKIAVNGDNFVKSHLLDHHMKHLHNETKELITYYGNDEHKLKLAKAGPHTPFQQKILAKYGNHEVHSELLKSKHLDQHAAYLIAERGNVEHIDTILKNHKSVVSGDWGVREAISTHGTAIHRKILAKEHGWNGNNRKELRKAAKLGATNTYRHK